MGQGPDAEVRTGQVSGENDDPKADPSDAGCNITVREQWDYRGEITEWVA